MAIIDQHTGYVKGIVGGRGKKTGSLTLNRATDTPHQPGSCFKILSTYGPALDLDEITLATVKEDGPTTYSTGQPVRNATGTYSGDVTIRYAIQQSINTIAVQTIQQIFARAAQEMKEQPLVSQQERTAYYMEALASCAPLIDKEVFDHYKNLEHQYKDVLHQIAGCLDQFQPDCRKMIRDSIRKACGSRMILAEKYIGLAEEEDK